MRVTNKQLTAAFGRILATGYKSGAVSTENIQEEILFLARLSGDSGENFLINVLQKRDEILQSAGVFSRSIRIPAERGRS